MKLLITGATGLVGTALVKSLRRDGHFVARLLRKKIEAQQQTKQGCDLEWDAQSGEFGALAQDADAVVNLAGASVADRRWSADRRALLRSSRIETTRGLVIALEKMRSRPKVLISASATGYYGSRGDEELTEQNSTGTDFLARLAEEWETEALRARALGIRVVLARFGIILARHGGALPKMMLPIQMFVGGKLGAGTQWMSWVALEDAVRAIRFALENEAVSGAINIVAPQPVTNADFTRILARVMHRPAFFSVPASVLRLLLADMADEMLLASQRAVPGVLQQSGYQFLHNDLSSTLAAMLKS
jgi:uncharacterized protein (TIGR01777 family)